MTRNHVGASFFLLAFLILLVEEPGYAYERDPAAWQIVLATTFAGLGYFFARNEINVAAREIYRALKGK